MFRLRTLPLVGLLLLLLGGSPLGVIAQSASSPSGSPTIAQPQIGPGGAGTFFDQVIVTQPAAPSGSPYWLWEPAAPHPYAPSGPLPLVIFFHGYMGDEPDASRAWLDHVVQRGAIVVDPVAGDPTGVAAAVRDALAVLASGSHSRPDLTRVAAVGHSAGGNEALAYAAQAAALGAPVPSAVFAASPGCDPDCIGSYAAIPASTRIVVLMEAQDQFGEAVQAQDRRLWAALTNTPADHKDFVVVQSDAHGQPPLVADHGQPLAAAGQVDALDWYGTWRLLDDLMNCSFAKLDCAYVFGDTPEQRFMGVWSDGVPVKEAQVVSNPGTPTP
jgi:acetyl esterase/lipase